MDLLFKLYNTIYDYNNYLNADTCVEDEMNDERG